MRTARTLAPIALLALTACAEDDSGYDITVTVDSDTVSIEQRETNDLYVTILNGNGQPPGIGTPVSMLCISLETGGPFGSLGESTEGIGQGNTGLVGDAQFTFFCGNTPGLVICTASATVDGSSYTGQATPFTCE